ncbi:MAG: hypothetical protein J6A83_00395 [Clostridia bacterium]|nr:hypothetical protein [Clostridia bacterium]
MKKSLICIFMAVAILLCAVGCSNTENPAETTAGTTAATTTATTPKPEEKFMSETLFENGVTDFQLVYDGKDITVKSCVDAFVDFMLKEHNVEIGASDINQDDKKYGKELIIGNARAVAEPVIESMNNRSDFAIKVLEDAIVLCATNELSYKYLFGYFEEMITVGGIDNLTLTSDDNVVYSVSEMRDMSYIDYWMRANNKTACDLELIKTVFERRNNTYEGTTLPYSLYVPFDYTPDKNYPVLLFMHGAGSRGNDGEAPLGTGIVTNLFNLEEAPVKDAIIIVPQCPAAQKWVDMDWTTGAYSVDDVPESNEMKCVVDILEKIFDEFSVDYKRVYMTGNSMGGIAVWDLLSRYNGIFAGAVPICGTGDVNKASVLKNTAIWTVHGTNDSTVPFDGTENVYYAIKEAGGDKIKFTVLQGYGHNVWDWTSKNDEIYTWLFQQSK